MGSGWRGTEKRHPKDAHERCTATHIDSLWPERIFTPLTVVGGIMRDSQHYQEDAVAARPKARRIFISELVTILTHHRGKTATVPHTYKECSQYRP